MDEFIDFTIGQDTDIETFFAPVQESDLKIFWEWVENRDNVGKWSSL